MYDEATADMIRLLVYDEADADMIRLLVYDEATADTIRSWRGSEMIVLKLRNHADHNNSDQTLEGTDSLLNICSVIQ